MDVSRCKSQLPRLKEEAGASKVVIPGSLVPVKSLLSLCSPQRAQIKGLKREMVGERNSSVTMSWAWACSALEKET